MPVQTTVKTHIYFPDGCKVEADTGSGYSDLGAINSAVTATLEWEENQIETANAGKLDKVIRNMTMKGGFTLINLDPEGVEKLGGGVFTKVDVAGTEIASFEDQVVPINWNDKTRYPLEIMSASAGVTDIQLRFTAAPALTSVTLDAGGSPEVLTAWGAAASGDYTIVADPNAYSGWSIVFNSASMSTGSPKTKAITIVYAANTPIASETIYAGSSTATLTAYALKFTHTDSASKKRILELYSVDAESGGFQFSFKEANEDGLEEMPLTFVAKIDSTKTDGRQLMGWTVENGAE